MSKLFWGVVLGFAFLPGALFAANSEHYQLIQSVINSAGSTRTASGKCLHDSLGEAVVGQSFGTQCSVQAGFLSSYLVQTPTAVVTPAPTLVPDSEKRLRIFHSQLNPNHGEKARVRWYQAEAGMVTLRIYNLLGNQVATLAENQQFPGERINELCWDGKSSGGAVVGSGIYVVYIDDRGVKSQAKICVVK